MLKIGGKNRLLRDSGPFIETSRRNAAVTEIMDGHVLKEVTT